MNNSFGLKTPQKISALGRFNPRPSPRMSLHGTFFAATPSSIEKSFRRATQHHPKFFSSL
jgi:hypothetical protein